MSPTAVGRDRPRMLLIAAAAVLFGLTSCGTDTASDYDTDNKDALLAACTDSDVDDLLQQRLCLCVFEEARASIGFDRFVEFDDLLGSEPDTALPPELVDVIAGCVIEEADL